MAVPLLGFSSRTLLTLSSISVDRRLALLLEIRYRQVVINLEKNVYNCDYFMDFVHR